MSVNINKATIQDIQSLGFQPEMAKYVIDCRDYYKGFYSENDLHKMELTPDEMRILVSNVTYNDTEGSGTLSLNLNNILNSAGSPSTLTSANSTVPVNSALPNSGSNDIVFSNEETEIPPNVYKAINNYIDKFQEQYLKMLGKYQDATNNFETTMSFGDEPVTLGYGSIIEILDTGVSLLINTTTPAGIFITFGKALFRSLKSDIDKVNESNDQANKKQLVSQWIREQRNLIDKYRDSFLKSELIFELENQYLEAANKTQAYQQLYEATAKLASADPIPLSEIEKGVYEKWITANNYEFSMEASGCLELEFELEEDERIGMTNNGVLVIAFGGAAIQTALNEILRKNLPSFRNPLDLKVKKRVVFHAPGIAGGKARYCGWLDENNQILFYPNITDLTNKAMGWTSWRTFYKKFAE